MTLTQGGVCEGYGGLSLAVTEVLGAKLAWYSEIEPAACRLLEHHHDLPNHGDLTTTDWSQVEPVDVFTGGWPCQPWSLAGKQKGAADERAIWPHVARAIRDLRPRLVFLENVASIAPAGELARAAGDLAALGYVGSWRCVRASDVGAPHQRARIFIVARPAAADPEDFGHERARPARRRGAGSAHSGHAATHADSGPIRQQPVALAGRGRASVAGRVGETATDTTGDGRHEGRPEPARFVGGLDAAERGDAATDTPCIGRSRRVEPQPQLVSDRPESAHARTSGGDWAGYAPAIQRWEHVTGRRAPAPTVLSARGNHQLSPRFTEWLMGLPDGHVTDVPGLSRNEQLKLCGNGVVPQQAAYALRLMLAADLGQVAA